MFGSLVTSESRHILEIDVGSLVTCESRHILNQKTALPQVSLEIEANIWFNVRFVICKVVRTQTSQRIRNHTTIILPYSQLLGGEKLFQLVCRSGSHRVQHPKGFGRHDRGGRALRLHREPVLCLLCQGRHQARSSWTSWGEDWLCSSFNFWLVVLLWIFKHFIN